jgi:hypothetical protein
VWAYSCCSQDTTDTAQPHRLAWHGTAFAARREAAQLPRLPQECLVSLRLLLLSFPRALHNVHALATVVIRGCGSPAILSSWAEQRRTPPHVRRADSMLLRARTGTACAVLAVLLVLLTCVPVRNIRVLHPIALHGDALRQNRAGESATRDSGVTERTARASASPLATQKEAAAHVVRWTRPARTWWCAWGPLLADAIFPEAQPALEYKGRDSTEDDVLVVGRYAESYDECAARARQNFSKLRPNPGNV